MKSYISASGLKTFEDCPRQWWYKYESDKEPVEGDTRALDLGSAVHETIELVLTTDPPPQWDAWEEWDIESRFLDVYEQQFAASVAEEYQDRAIKCLKNAARYLEKREPQLRGVEVSVEYNLNRPDVDGLARGTMDVATDTEIWDWKTGGIYDDTAKKEKIQGAAYMGAYRVEYGEAPEAIRFIYLREEAVRSIEPSDEVWEYFVGYARRLAAAKKNDAFEATPGKPCQWCDYQSYCPAAGGIGENFDWQRWTAV